MNVAEISSQIKALEDQVPSFVHNINSSAAIIKSKFELANKLNLYSAKILSTIIDPSDLSSPTWLLDPKDYGRPNIAYAVQASGKYNDFILGLGVGNEFFSDTGVVTGIWVSYYLDNLKKLVINVSEAQRLRQSLKDYEAASQIVVEIAPPIVQAGAPKLLEKTFTSEVSSLYLDSLSNKSDSVSVDSMVESPKLSLTEIKRLTVSEPVIVTPPIMQSSTVIDSGVNEIKSAAPQSSIKKKLMLGASAIGLYFLSK